MRMMATTNEVTGPVNLGNPEEKSVKELSDIVIALTGSKSILLSESIPSDDPKVRCPSLSKAQGILNRWKPKTKLVDGLKITINNFKELNSQPINNNANEEDKYVGDLSPR